MFAMELRQQDNLPPFLPPEAVRRMKTLDRALFSRSVCVPALRVSAKHIGALTKGKVLRSYVLKMPRIKSVAELADADPDQRTHKLILLDPRKCQTCDDFTPEEVKSLTDFDIDVKKMELFEIELGYDNWTLSDILRAVLPADTEAISGFSIIGHIAHLNLKSEVVDYKHLIGQVVLDKNSSVKTVVNKLNIIDNTFRNFQMELLAGNDDFIARTKENGCMFELDFSKVYWNPRLGTEHQRVVDLLNKGDVLYDVFAGVGPFAIPAAKKGVTVFANDLNPESYSALVKNAKLNKVSPDAIAAYNLDGREFIKTVLRNDALARLQHVVGTTLADAENKNGGRPDADRNDLRQAQEEPVDEERAREDGNNEKSLDVSKESELDSGLVEELPCLGSARQQEAVNARAPADGSRIFVVMNLPALALDFLNVFPGLLATCPESLRTHPAVAGRLPVILCYAFSKSDQPEADVRRRAEGMLGRPLPADAQVRTVRNVAPYKDMLCLSFQLSPAILFEATGSPVQREACSDNPEQANDAAEPAGKRMKIS